jgi:hypothetical protein
MSPALEADRALLLRPLEPRLGWATIEAEAVERLGQNGTEIWEHGNVLVVRVSAC